MTIRIVDSAWSKEPIDALLAEALPAAGALELETVT